jgi:hypothetical protein
VTGPVFAGDSTVNGDKAVPWTDLTGSTSVNCDLGGLPRRRHDPEPPGRAAGERRRRVVASALFVSGLTREEFAGLGAGIDALLSKVRTAVGNDVR